MGSGSIANDILSLSPLATWYHFKIFVCLRNLFVKYLHEQICGCVWEQSLRG